MHILWRITKLAMLSPWRMAAAWVTLIVATALFLAVPRLIGHAIDHALPSEAGPPQSLDWPFFAGLDQTQTLIALGVLVIVVVGLRGIFNYANLYLAEAISQRTSYHIRNLLYDKLQHLSFAFHDREHTGNLMSKATVDVEMTRMYVSMALIRSGQILLLSLGAAIAMLLIDWQLGLIGLLFVPVIALRAIIASTRMRMLWRRAQVEMGRMTTVLQENLAGQRVVKAFGAEEHEEAKYAERNQDVYDWTFSARKAQASNTSLMTLIFWGATGLIVWIGGYAVVNGRISVGELSQFIFYTSLLVQPVRMVGFLVNTFARAISAGERLFDVLDAPSPVQEKPEAKILTNVRGHVRFNDVTFSYGERPAVHNVSLDVPPGHVVALLGAPGSGKSTLVHLLARFYDVTDGSVTIDGVDVRDVTLASLRRAVGIVQQDVFLFSASVRENIAYGREDATLDDVIQAAKTAQLHDEIMALPEGYETMVGERGMTLSGGQRQRLAIARTLLLDPPVLVLDDSTASVDAGTESRIQQAMEAVVKGRTTFVIAHRLSSIQHAHTVVVLEHGRIAEMGSPQELMASGGLFAHVAELQYATNLNGHAAAPRSTQPRGAGL